ncbi:MAG: tetratricopeptide repeat protein, partial [Myxococcota bacterium]
NPYLAGTHYHLGLTLVAQGQPEAAALHFRSSLELNPGDQRAREQLDVLAGSAPPPGATSPESP